MYAQASSYLEPNKNVLIWRNRVEAMSHKQRMTR